MPYYSFKVYSTRKTVLTKQFTTQDCLDLHFLLANKDYIGVDIFCQQKYEEYSNDKTRLNCFDKFLYLFSQKILSHTFDLVVSHQGEKEKIKKYVSLVKLYNDIESCSFKLKESYKQGDLEIIYGIPYDLNCSNNYIFYSIKTNNCVYENIENLDSNTASSLPIKLYTNIQNMQVENNKKINSKYFEQCFLKELDFSNNTFLYFLDFIYSENVGDFFMLCYNLNKEFHVHFNHIKTITMRELFLLVDTINTSIKEKKAKSNE